jgi:hypothetical protein
MVPAVLNVAEVPPGFGKCALLGTKAGPCCPIPAAARNISIAIQTALRFVIIEHLFQIEEASLGLYLGNIGNGRKKTTPLEALIFCDGP